MWSQRSCCCWWWWCWWFTDGSVSAAAGRASHPAAPFSFGGTPASLRPPSVRASPGGRGGRRRWGGRRGGSLNAAEKLTSGGLSSCWFTVSGGKHSHALHGKVPGRDPGMHTSRQGRSASHRGKEFIKNIPKTALDYDYYYYYYFSVKSPAQRHYWWLKGMLWQQESEGLIHWMWLTVALLCSPLKNEKY